MMEAVEAGDFSVRYSEPPADELGRLGNNFNHMLNKIQELISQIYEEQKNCEIRNLRHYRHRYSLIFSTIPLTL